jgi:membrane-associated phospholipid phosphatase
MARAGGALPAPTQRIHALRNVGLLAATATVVLTVATRTKGVQRLDDALERAAGRRRRRLRRIALVATLPGEKFAHPTIGATIAFTVLAMRGGRARRILVPLAGASIGAILAHHGVKLVYRRPRPAIVLRRGKTEPAFPSGHTADVTAVLATGAYLLVREGVLSADIAAPCAIGLAFMTGVSRVALGEHWGTDVVGGWLTGVAIAAACGHAYERLRLGRSPARRSRPTPEGPASSGRSRPFSSR